MKLDTSLSDIASEYLSWIGASTSNFERRQIKTIDISMQTKADLPDYIPCHLIHSLVKVTIRKENVTITSTIHIADKSNIEKLRWKPTEYDVENEKANVEVTGVFLSHSDANEVLTNLFKNSYTYSNAKL